MAEGGFFRGTSVEQDGRFRGSKTSELRKRVKMPSILQENVDIRKVSLAVVKPWISQNLTETLGIEDEVVVSYVINMLEQNTAVESMYIQVLPFLEDNTWDFMKELWGVLLEAQRSSTGVPESWALGAEEMQKKEKKGAEGEENGKEMSGRQIDKALERRFAMPDDSIPRNYDGVAAGGKEVQYVDPQIFRRGFSDTPDVTSEEMIYVPRKRARDSGGRYGRDDCNSGRRRRSRERYGDRRSRERYNRRSRERDERRSRERDERRSREKDEGRSREKDEGRSREKDEGRSRERDERRYDRNRRSRERDDGDSERRRRSSSRERRRRQRQ